MNNHQAELELKRSRVLVENNAQAIFDHLSELVNLGGIHERRWLWELLQNAKDAVDEGERVSVEVDLQDDSLFFRHNGTPFTDNEIIHLIYHGSTKKGLSGKTGKFGTGFLATHLLSTRVLVSGILTDGNGFQFMLDRSGRSAEEVEAAMERSWEDFKKSRAEVTAHFFTTTYRYQLEGDNKTIAQQGLRDLPRLLPFVLAFNQKFDRFALRTTEENIEFVRTSTQKDDRTDIMTVTVESRKQGCEAVPHVLVIAHDNRTDVAIPCRIESDKMVIGSLSVEVPRLFYDFPLFGTEDFSFPAVINSRDFIPKSERDGVYLGKGASEDIAHNKSIIQEVCRLYLLLVDYAVVERWQNLYELANITLPIPKDWLDSDWFHQILHDLFDGLNQRRIIKTEGDEYITMGGAMLPVDPPVVELWELAFPFFSSRLPSQGEIESWRKIMQSWGDLFGRSIDSFDNILTFEKLCGTVSRVETVEKLEVALGVGGTDQSTIWLHSLHQHIMARGQKSFFESYALIPDQNGILKKKTTSMFLDDGIDETIKDISKAVGDDCRDSLALQAINLDSSLLATKTEEEVTLSTISTIKQKCAKSTQDAPLRKPVIDIFTWLVKRRRGDLLLEMPVVSRKAEVDAGRPFSGISAANRLLVPPELWEAVPMDYCELFPPDLVLSSEYAENLNAADWKFLADSRLVYPDPILSEETRLESHLIFSDDSDVVKEHELQAVECSRIAFLDQPKDKGVISRVRKSRVRSILFLKFLVSCLIHADTRWLEPIDLTCECGSVHSVLPAHWFYYVKARKWVPSETGGSEALSVLSLARLLADEPTIMLKLREDKPALFLNRIGIGVGDLLRNIVTGGDDAKLLQWDKTLGVILTSGLDPGQLQAEFEKRERDKEKVLSNQKLGEMIESIFEATFRSGQFRDMGIGIERTGIGSDYEVEHDFTDGMQEQLLNFRTSQRTVLVEIKSTVKPFVSMTQAQGRKAVQNKDAFCLCVVSLGSTDVTGEIIRDRARFVTNIGVLLGPKLMQTESLEDLRSKAASMDGDIQVDISGAEVKYRVGQPVWEGGMNLDQFLAYLVYE